MYKPQVHKPLPPGSPIRIQKGQKQARVVWDGKQQWLPVSPAGKVIGPASKWYAKIDGKPTPLARDKVTSEKMLAEKRVKAERVREGLALPDAKNVETWPQLLARYRQERLRQGLSPLHVEKSHRQVVIHLEGLGVKSLDDWRNLTGPKIARWLDGLKRRHARKPGGGNPDLVNKPFAKASLVAYCVALQTFGKWLKKQRLVGVLPEFPAISQKAENKRAPITKEMLAKLVAVAPTEIGLFYRLCFATLARVGAIFSLVAEDFNLDAPGGPWVSLRPENAKTNVGQVVPLPPGLARELRPLIEAAKGGKVFNKFSPASITKRLNLDLRAAGIEKYQPDGVLCAHSLRHGGTSHLLKNGLSPFIVMRLGGWKNMEMLTKHYGHIFAMDAQEHVARLME